MLGFREVRPLVHDPIYADRKAEAFKEFQSHIRPDYDPDTNRDSYPAGEVMDPPLVELVQGFNDIPHCFTGLSCCGHFLPKGVEGYSQGNMHRVEEFPEECSQFVFTFPYMVFGLENSEPGEILLEQLGIIARQIPRLFRLGSYHPDNGKINEYVLELNPTDNLESELVLAGRKDALILEQGRDTMFYYLRKVLEANQKEIADRVK